jgi:predicted NAD/FAD-binding protein
MKRKDPRVMALPVTRRAAISGMASVGVSLLGCGAAPEGVGSASLPLDAPRMAIVGGGAGGLAAAYFLDGVCAVDLFESRSKVGGHADSQTVQYGGQPVVVDLGAQFFHPATHPIYVSLLEELALYNPDSPNDDQTLEAPGSVCIFPTTGGYPFGSGWPRFCSTQPLLTPFRAIDFAIYSQVARQAILGNMSYEVRLDDWINGLPVSRDFKDNLLFPWISSLIGATRESANRSSARSILQTFALAFPSDILAGASTYNSSIGLGGNLDRLLARASGARVQLNAGVQALSYSGGKWTVTTASGSYGPYDALVMNAPPHTSKGFLSALPWAGDIVDLLARYEYFDARIAVHTDPAYIHRDKTFRTVYNAGIDGSECEGSVWLGGIHGKLPNGSSIDIYKSWVERRRSAPKNVLLQRNFRHPLITPDVIRATRSLAAFQGKNGLYFSGQHTTGFDLQEAAVYSAMKVADALAPTSPKLAALRARLEARGRTGISYDL